MALAVEDLDDGKRVRILGIIDKLREHGVGKNVSLPQVSFWLVLLLVRLRSSCNSLLLSGTSQVENPPFWRE
jgi:hypothetical protein